MACQGSGMSFDSGPIDRYLSAAFGDDAAMAEDLRRAFVGSARDLADLMRRARCDANWAVAAKRLKGLAATFGIVPLIQLAEGGHGLHIVLGQFAEHDAAIEI